LLDGFRAVFTRGGWVRFAQWVTGMVLCDEEHTLTQILGAIGMESHWRVLEHFAEYGSWDRPAVERQLLRLVARHAPTPRGAYRRVALDDTKEHRSSAGVWGTCTFHESTARSPNRAETVRAHNWVVLGELVPGRPWTYLPLQSRLYMRQSQLPAGERFLKKTQLAAEMLRTAARQSAAPLLAAFDGAYAVATVIRPCLNPTAGERRIEFVTRLRRDARLYQEWTPAIRNRRGGRPRKHGLRLPAPQRHEQWGVRWQRGRAYVYGRMRRFRYKRLRCTWSVSGPEHAVHAFVFQVQGYSKQWYTVTSALQLSAADVLSSFAARFRQEDGFRDHKGRLGMEECRAWTKEPVLRTFQVQLVAQTLLRLLQRRLDADGGRGSWWRRPAWNRHKRHPSLLDVRRLLWRHRREFSKLLLGLDDLAKPPQAHFPCEKPIARAA
jgi:hypothetical protein